MADETMTLEPDGYVVLLPDKKSSPRGFAGACLTNESAMELASKNAPAEVRPFVFADTHAAEIERLTAELAQWLTAELAQWRDEYDLAIAERKAPEWQPIESAPKGNAILIYYTNEFGNERIVKALYIERFTEEAEPASENDEYNEADDTYYTLPGWYEMIDNWGDYSSVAIHHNPSHWMPLPAAPKVTP